MKTANTPKTDSDHQPVQPRQPYTKPKLVSYGDIREVTRTMGGTTGMNDGGAGNDKTGF